VWRYEAPITHSGKQNGIRTAKCDTTAFLRAVFGYTACVGRYWRDLSEIQYIEPILTPDSPLKAHTTFFYFYSSLACAWPLPAVFRCCFPLSMSASSNDDMMAAAKCQLLPHHCRPFAKSFKEYFQLYASVRVSNEAVVAALPWSITALAFGSQQLM
jgi:hypothetical protein